MENLENYLYAKLEAMQTEKAKLPVNPNMVTKAELFSAIDKDIRNVLNKMFHEKQIRVHKTVHAPIQDFVELVKD